MVNIWFDLIGTFDLFPLEAFCFWKYIHTLIIMYNYINNMDNALKRHLYFAMSKTSVMLLSWF